MLKFYDFNSELQENKDIKLSFELKGVNKPELFVSVFQSGKAIVEGVQASGSFWDYYMPLMNLVTLIVNALRKSQ